MKPAFFCSSRECPLRWKKVPGPDREHGKCKACGEATTRVRRLKRGHGQVALKPEFFSYYDHSLGQHVDSREQKARIYKERGLQDWEPVPGSRASEHVLDRLKHPGRKFI